MTLLDLKKRVPEPQEEMEGDEAKAYLKSHLKKSKNSNPSYKIVANDILRKTKISKGDVIDFGCGYGALIKSLQKKNKDLNFTGIDLSKMMLELG